jgi:hypothetical protein
MGCSPSRLRKERRTTTMLSFVIWVPRQRRGTLDSIEMLMGRRVGGSVVVITLPCGGRWHIAVRWSYRVVVVL